MKFFCRRDSGAHTPPKLTLFPSAVCSQSGGILIPPSYQHYTASRLLPHITANERLWFARAIHRAGFFFLFST